MVLYRLLSVAILFLSLLFGLFISGPSWCWFSRGCDCWKFLNFLNTLITFIINIFIAQYICFVDNRYAMTLNELLGSN